ncbi:MAG TPA: universal stress protein [Gaiellaceae bacterium]|nr:universal stress protein [Gaiellaceae bacterium]
MNRNRPILLATDGSPSAGEAQRQAFDLAKLSGAPLLVVSVSHATLPTVGYSAYGYSEIVSELSNAEHKRLDALLGAVTEAATKEGIDCATVEADGAIVEEICRIAAEREAQLVVVGSHGWGAARRLLSGSVSTGLVHSAPCPVLVVRTSISAQTRAAA